MSNIFNVEDPNEIIILALTNVLRPFTWVEIAQATRNDEELSQFLRDLRSKWVVDLINRH